MTMFEDSYIITDLEPSMSEHDAFDDCDLPVAPDSWRIEDFEDILAVVKR